jgi:hypothetical protein
MPLKSMRLPAEGTLLGGEAATPLAPEFPYGLRIDLDNDSLKKLGIESLPEVGKSMMLHARVVVNSVSENESSGQEKRKSVGLQITDMALGSEGEKRDAAQVIYMEDN